MLIVIARYVVAEAHESTVARLLRKNAEASRVEPGCLEFSVYQEIDDPRAFLLYGGTRVRTPSRPTGGRRTSRTSSSSRWCRLNERAWTRVEELPT